MPQNLQALAQRDGRQRYDTTFLLDSLKQAGVCVGEILDEYDRGDRSEANRYISRDLRSFYGLLQTVTRIAPADIGLSMGKVSYLREYGAYYQQLEGCTSLWETSKKVKSFVDCHAQPNLYRDEFCDKDWAFRFALRLPMSEHVTLLLDELIARTKYELEHFIGSEIKFRRIELSYRPAARRSVYEELFDCPVRFDCERTAVVIDREYAGSTCQHDAAARRTDRNCEWEDEVELRERMAIAILEILVFHPGSYPSLQRVADAFGMSASTIKRWLTQGATNYRALVDLVRTEHVAEYLALTDQAPKEIAHRLGFTNVHNFRRAFRRWMGMTPAEFRKSTGPAAIRQPAGRSNLI